MNNQTDTTDYSFKIQNFFTKQLEDWPMAKKNYIQLSHIISKEIPTPYFQIILQFNPERIRSASAKIDESSLKSRPCFLCEANRPQEQHVFKLNEQYSLLVNPYPIFQKHLTIPAIIHQRQAIQGHISDMIQFAKKLSEYVIFYNGPKCGASAPDHLHFQAVIKGEIPYQHYFNKIKTYEHLVFGNPNGSLYQVTEDSIRSFVIHSHKALEIEVLFNRLYDAAKKVQPQEEEPMMNLLCWYDHDQWYLVVFLRKAHRPWQYNASEEERLLISPASVEMGGFFVCARKEDFLKLNHRLITDILDQVCITPEQQQLIVSFL